MIECVRRIQFAAGHRVLNHESRCKYPHGHNYVVYFHARAKAGQDHLDSIGRVIDFGVLKQRLGEWIDVHWDHGFLFWERDAEIRRRALASERWIAVPFNPTAENIARYLLEEVAPRQLIGTGVEIWKVRVEETENCSATATLEGRNAVDTTGRTEAHEEGELAEATADVGARS